jgi:hypothetical protein
MNDQNKNSDWTSWIPIVVLFCIPYTWPIALILLFRKLMGLGGKKRQSNHPYDIQRQQAQQRQQAAQQAQQTQQQTQQSRQTAQQARQAAPKAPSDQPERPKFPKGRGLTIAGGILTGVFGFASILEFADALSWGGLVYELDTILPLVALLCLGLVLLTCGVSRTRKGRRLRKYLSLIGKRKSVSIEALVRVTGASRRQVVDDLQSMLDSGLLPTGYLDLSRDVLILSDEGIPDEAPQPEPTPEPEPPQDDYAVLQEIRAVNDAIPDPVMSQKIDRIGEITGKILDYQRQHPNQSAQLRSFLNYYLPTTLKILRSYAQLDAQGVEGENISAAKARIEGMMDKVVEGFENQLDKLFQDSAMDISSDVAVLEKMLEKDGLSGPGQGMTL